MFRTLAHNINDRTSIIVSLQSVQYWIHRNVLYPDDLHRSLVVHGVRYPKRIFEGKNHSTKRDLISGSHTMSHKFSCLKEPPSQCRQNIVHRTTTSPLNDVSTILFVSITMIHWHPWSLCLTNRDWTPQYSWWSCFQRNDCWWWNKWVVVVRK